MIEAIAKQVRWFRVPDAWKSTNARIEINVVDESPAAKLWAQIDLAMQKHMRSEVKSGIAPMSNVERKVQEALKDFEG